MSLPFLFIGSNEKTRGQTALETANKHSEQFDIIFFDTNETTRIADLREVVSKIHRKPFHSKHQTLVIYEIQNLSLEAQNTLLKMLEEPPESAVLILTAPSKEGVLSTISSRCELHELTHENQEPPTNKILSFMKKGVMDRFKSLDSLEIDELVAYYRHQLLYEEENAKNTLDKPKLLKSISYLKLLIKAKRAIRKRASKKIVKTFLLLEAPKL